MVQVGATRTEKAEAEAEEEEEEEMDPSELITFTVHLRNF
jgi:hypothetical protein